MLRKENIQQCINPLTPGTFCQNCDILVVLRLDLGQISFSLVEKAFATRQLAVTCHCNRL